MTRAVIYAVVCAFSLGACHIRHSEGCDDDDFSGAGRPELPDLPSGTGGTVSSSSGGNGATSGSDGSGSGGSSTGGTAGSDDLPTPCAEEADCPRGFNCDYEAGECTPADAETCAELSSEDSCDNRNDCVAVYAGTNCSCGPECACIGGEPGCVCESFAFFACEVAEE
jgi:hypothetical protein